MSDKFIKGNSSPIGVPLAGMNRYFIGSSGVGTMVGALNAGNNFVQGNWEDNPNKYQQLGSDAADTAGEGLMLGMAGIMGIQHARTFGTTKGAVHGGQTYNQLAKGGWEGIGTGKQISEAEMKGFMANKSAFEVNVRKGQPFKPGAKGAVSRMAGTYKPMGMRGNLYMMGAQIALTIGAKFALGFAGKVLDEAYSENRHFRRPEYDNRFFNTRQNDMSSYQQLGAAMESYENKMMSVARIYHSRG